MKKRNFKRWISILLVAVMCLGLFVGCANNGRDELGNLVGATTDENKTPANDTNSETNGNTNSETSTPSDTQQNADCSKELAALQAELDAANKALEEANASIKTLEDSNAALTAKLNAESNPFTFEEEGKPVSINLEDAEKLLRVEMANGTYAYRIGKGTPIDVIDEVVLKNGKPYAEQTFELAHHKGSVYVIAGVDAEGKVQVLQMVYGDKLYAYNKSWAQPKAGEGFELLETKKMFGKVDIALLFADAICVYEDAESEWGYSLCLNTTGEYVAPAKPAPSKPEEKPVEKPEDNPVEKPEEKPTVTPEIGKPENNPEPDDSQNGLPGEGPGDMSGTQQKPENNPPLDETDDVPVGAGPADMKENNPPMNQGNLPSDMNEGSNTTGNNEPADMSVKAPADISNSKFEAPADMAENSPPVEDDVSVSAVNVTFATGAPVDIGNTVNSSADNGPADIADGPADM